jgi:acyl-CoA synthetase (NDP forming)
MVYSKLITQKKWQEAKLDEYEDFKIINNLEDLKYKLRKEDKFCSNDLTGEILDSFGINYSKEILVNNENEVINACKKINGNLFVARISSPDIPHKSDA